MIPEAASPRPPRFSKSGPASQWAALLAVSALFTAAFELGHLPAAFLIGPMLAGIVLSVNGSTIQVPKLTSTLSQAVIGSLVAMSISTESLSVVLTEGTLLMAVTIATLAASGLLGWLISTWKIMPGASGLWGSAPGGAAAMVIMAEAFGADGRLVACMQYLRVILVSLAAALVSRVALPGVVPDIATIEWLPAIETAPFAATLVVISLGPFLGRMARLPSPFFFGPLILAAVFHWGFDIALQLPPWLLVFSYALIGWSVGLRFTRAILGHVLRFLPQILAAVLALMAFCGGLGYMLTLFFEVDPLTAYLATSPGGLDTVAIIAAASNAVDMSFVMAFQTARLILVLLICPWLARLFGPRGAG